VQLLSVREWVQPSPTDGRLVQAIGARLTGIIKTSPVNEIIGHIEKEGCIVLDNTSACVDQVEGVERAIELGFKRVAVTVAGFQSEAMTEIREVELILKQMFWSSQSAILA